MRTDLLLERGLRPQDSKIIASTWQDVEPVLERNHALRTQQQHSDWGRHVASIPNVILTKWLNEAYARGHVSLRIFTPEFDEFVKQKLQDPEWAYLRTDK